MYPHATVYKNIWLADDDIDDREIFGEIVHQILPTTMITTFSDGEELLAALYAGGIPDLLFLDINMPCRDGLDCLQEIRTMPAFSKLPIIIFSSSVQPKHIENAYGYGANLYYSKPTIFNEMISGLTRLLAMDWSDPYTSRPISR